MLTCDNVTLYRDEKIIFKNLAFSLLPGCLLHIKGRNGSGKTSLLRILSRLITEHEGYIRYNDINVTEALDEYFSLIRYIPSIGFLDLELTVKEQIRLWAYFLDSEAAVEAANNTLGFTREILSKRIFTLSFGYQQRLRLLFLLLSDSKIWFLDEPFNSLDQDAVKILGNMIEARRVQGGIIIYTDHSDISLKDETILQLSDFI